jgi:secondary thiamine-phosphate synthase enzyme
MAPVGRRCGQGMMFQSQTTLEIRTQGAGLYEFTERVEGFVSALGMRVGLLTVFCAHTSCSLLIQENADPSVQADLQSFFKRLVPHGMDWVTHRTEGPDDMPAHIKAALTQTSLGLPITGGALALGMWQGIYLFEHRERPHRRSVVLHAAGE